MILIKGVTFISCNAGIKIKGMKKNPSPTDDLSIQIEDNTFETTKTNCMHFEHIFPGSFSITKNTVTKCNSTAIRIIGCRAVKSDINFIENNMSSVYHSAVCIDSSIVLFANNSITSCQGGVILFLVLPSISSHREDIYDSHRDIILRDSVKDVKDSYNAGSGSNHSNALVSLTLLGGGGGGPGSSRQASTNDAQFASNFSRVIMRENKFKEIAHYGVMVQYNGSCSIKISDCKFRNVKEPVLINERDVTMSRNNTRNYYHQDNSELLAPTYQATPRQLIQSSGKGTIVVKNNAFEGSETCVVKKHLSSYLYDINNTRQSRQHLI